MHESNVQVYTCDNPDCGATETLSTNIFMPVGWLLEIKRDEEENHFCSVDCAVRLRDAILRDAFIPPPPTKQESERSEHSASHTNHTDYSERSERIAEEPFKQDPLKEALIEWAEAAETAVYKAADRFFDRMFKGDAK